MKRLEKLPAAELLKLNNEYNEIIKDNNNLTASTSIKSERGTGLLPYPNIITVLISILIVSKTMRRKAN